MAGIGGKPPMRPSGNAPGLICESLKTLREDNCMLSALFRSLLEGRCPITRPGRFVPRVVLPPAVTVSHALKLPSAKFARD